MYKNEINCNNKAYICFVSHSMSSRHHDGHGHKCWRRQRHRDRQYSLWTTTMSQNSFSFSLSFSLRLLSLSSHTTAQATTLSTVAPFVLPYKEIFSPGCLCHCCYELHSVVLLCRASCCLSMALSTEQCATSE